MLHWTSTIGHSHFKVSCGCCIVWVVLCRNWETLHLVPSWNLLLHPCSICQKTEGTWYSLWTPLLTHTPLFLFLSPPNTSISTSSSRRWIIKMGKHRLRYTDRRSNKKINLDSSKLPGLLSFFLYSTAIKDLSKDCLSSTIDMTGKQKPKGASLQSEWNSVLSWDNAPLLASAALVLPKLTVATTVLPSVAENQGKQTDATAQSAQVTFEAC